MEEIYNEKTLIAVIKSQLIHYVVVPCDDVIDVYDTYEHDTYEHDSIEMEIE